MAGSPKFKVYTADGEYVAACKHEFVAVGAALHAGEGSTIRLGHNKRDTLLTINENHWDSYDGTTYELMDALQDKLDAQQGFA